MIHKITFWRILFVATIAFYFISAFTRLSDPISQDELLWPKAAESLQETGTPLDVFNQDQVIAYSPHFYLQFIHLCYLLFGVNTIAARLPGLVAGFLSLLLVFFTSYNLVTGSKEIKTQYATISAFLLVTLPVMIQASAILEIDPTVLMPAILFLCVAVYRQIKKPSWPRTTMTVLAMTLALWMRTTTPVILIPIFVFFACFQTEHIKQCFRMILAMAAGICIFTATWWFYCNLTNVPFKGPFIYTYNSFFQRTDFNLGHVVQNIFYSVLWITPLALSLFIVVFGYRFIDILRKISFHREDLFLTCGIFLLVGYTFVGGSIFGFPKYQCPAFPLLSIATGLFLSQVKSRLSNLGLLHTILITLSGCLIQVFIFGDVLFKLRIQLREAYALAAPKVSDVIYSIIISIVCAGAAWLLVLLFSLRIKGKEAWLGTLLFLSIGAGTGMILLQNTADYYTGFNYGGECIINTAEYLKKETSKDKSLVVPSEIVCILNRPGLTYSPNSLWTDKPGLIKKLSAPENQGLVVSIVTNTPGQVKFITQNKTIQDLLKKHYTRSEIGRFFIWLRK